MFTNKLNQVYKPRRRLYYMDSSVSDVKDFCKGKDIPEVQKYNNAFGTYDVPGAFYIPSLDKHVVGIEFRIDDPMVEYPKDLESVILEETFFYSIEIENENSVDIKNVKEIFENISKDDDAHRNFSDLAIKNDEALIGVFPDGKKIRIQYEWELVEDRAQYVIRDEYDFFDKSYLYKCAFYDSVTGHYNWNHLVAFLEMPRDKGVSDYGFVHFDIKAFKVINEVYGHVAANKVLCKVVKAMNEADFVYMSARCHNDNFAMIIKDMPKRETIATLERFFEGLSVLEEDPNYKILFRCGVVLMPISLLSGNRVADAGKMAQSLGTDHSRTEITVYTEKMRDDALWGNYIKAYVETAIANDEFVVYVQPKFNSRNNTLKGMEALIRWNFKKKEFLSPARFIPFFEKDGAIGIIDDYVLKTVCSTLKRWKEEGRKLYPVSVNLSRSRMYDKNIIGYLTDIVDRYGVSHEYIDFELTESASYDDTEQMVNMLVELRKRGFKISMDDFGTGYSSLALLSSMPLDTLKIDKSFVDKIGISHEREEDLIVLKHIISLAEDLGFVCLAEGAERKEQVECLSKFGCDLIQGYYYCRPISIREFENIYLPSERP